MTPDLIYLPVSEAERALLRWLRASPYAADPVGVRDALRAAVEQGLDVEALGRLTAHKASPAPPSDQSVPLAEWQALKARVDAIEARFERLKRLKPIQARLSDSAPPTPAADISPDARIAVHLAGRLVEGATVPAYLEQLATTLIDGGLLDRAHLPLKTGRKRYLAHTEAVHPGGNRFNRAVEHRGVFFEANHSVRSIARATEKLSAALGLDCHIVHLDLRSRGDRTPG